MQLLSIYSAITLLQAYALAVIISPRCNADNCLRGLFGSNAKTTSANLAACSTGLPTVTIRVDGTMRTTMTGTVALPAVASVCDGQGAAKRAARFQSACSCVGIPPSTVIVTQSTMQSTTTAATASSTQATAQVTTQAASAETAQTTLQTATMSTTQSANPAEITLGQVAGVDNLLTIQGGYEFYGATAQFVYQAPRAGRIISATTFDATEVLDNTGAVTFQVWRPTADGSLQATLVGKSDSLSLTGSFTVKQFSLPQAIAVEAGDVIGLATTGGGAAFGTRFRGSTEEIFYSATGRVSDRGETQTFLRNVNIRLNVAAVLQYQDE